MASSLTSTFYNACRNNKVDEVKRMLSHMNVDEINRLETTYVGKSTALHAASYYGHYQVVELLLERRPDLTIRNFAQLTAADEAKTRDIKCLFRRHTMNCDTTNDRFKQRRLNLEWIAMGPSVVEKAARYRRWLKKASKNMESSISTIIINYLEKDERLTTDSDIKEIKDLFQKAADEDNPIYIVKAYTVETNFYRCLNEDLAGTTDEILNSNLIFDRLVEEFWNTHGRIAGIIARHPKLKRYSYHGECYRGIQLTNHQLFYYKIGTQIMTKSFSSCSQTSEMAMSFATKEFDSKSGKYPTLCKYTIKNNLSALDIAGISYYQDEKEVLIIPYTVFEIKRITWKTFELLTKDKTVKEIEGRLIELEECPEEKSDCFIL